MNQTKKKIIRPTALAFLLALGPVRPMPSRARKASRRERRPGTPPRADTG